ncbi:suppressor of fused domain protein [Loigolactobacillus binensis]|uniref:Suppressor of fused domain protein n=1 Tax=Loigolactobacillus binensis TaxID=2559922 RepID=A0ABW3ED31_9LACO|nr:suppressor of fused domain protein [Loigolactobacillus binensis]
MVNDSKLVANKILTVIGGTPKVMQYLNEDENASIDIFIGENRPDEGLTSYSTIGLSNYSIGLKTNDKKLRVELIGTSGTNFEYFGNIMSTCAFNIIVDHQSCHPGMVYTNIIDQYYSGTDMKHIFFVSPFLWERLTTLETKEKSITWLLMVPISDAELEFLEKNGSEALENKFIEQQIDIYDLGRNSVIS